MNTRSLILPAVLVLPACGGGGGTTTASPTSATAGAQGQGGQGGQDGFRDSARFQKIQECLTAAGISRLP